MSLSMPNDRDRIDAPELTITELGHVIRALIDKGEHIDAALAALITQVEPKDGKAKRFHLGEKVRTAHPKW
jgi:hypothetical protein